MLRKTNTIWLKSAIVIAGFILSACGYPLKYKLNETDIVLSKSKAPLKVEVAIFSDNREAIERQKFARKGSGYKDVGDYTHDKDFKGEEATSITKMIVSHLKYAGAFSEVQLSRLHSGEISATVLDSLSRQAIDAVMAGEIKNFYGYYDSKVGKALLYSVGLGFAFGFPLYMAGTSEETYTVPGPLGTTYQYTETKTNSLPGTIGTTGGVLLGAYLESLHKRNIEWHTQLNARLISTSTQKVLWEDTIEIRQKAHIAMPGLNSDKRKVAVNSLRDAVNRMVESLAKDSLTAEK
jgi:hypothetical protein